ncbi:MAG: GNAT family protein [Bacillota bacterium]|nr:GNAT family protein [Bacillota bacterium]
MGELIIVSNRLKFRKTDAEDLDFVLDAENAGENRLFINQWSREKHVSALEDSNVLHMVICDVDNKRVGYNILIGINNPSGELTMQRFVITEKGKGYGREALGLIKKIAFEKLGMHRLQLQVREYNERAKKLYKSEGFVEEGIMRESAFVDGAFKSSIMMSLLEQEY